ncbi:hypothetical protein AB0J83_07885 [Actinoplanes sp. NPDC049596]|uniref:hypothetical protein n=1 Tax=unclassified Actinoplanes TaxID=2626549 RepID=UPI003446CAC6
MMRVLRWFLVVAHAVLVLPVVWLWVAVAAPALHGPDANIGAGLVGLYLQAFGCPGP